MVYGNYGGHNHHKHSPHKLHDLPVLKRIANCVLESAKKSVVGGVGWSCTILDMAEILSYDHTPQHLHRDAPPYTVPDGTLIVNCLIMLTHNHEAEDGSHFVFVPSSSSGFPDPWMERAVPFKRGTPFFFNALDVHRGSGIPKASPTGVTHPRLMACFSIELTQGLTCHSQTCMSPSALSGPSLRVPPHGTPWPRGTHSVVYNPSHLFISEGGNHLPPNPPTPTTKNARWLFPPGASIEPIAQC